MCSKQYITAFKRLRLQFGHTGTSKRIFVFTSLCIPITLAHLTCQSADEKLYDSLYRPGFQDGGLYSES